MNETQPIENENDELVIVKMRQVRKARLRSDKTGQKLATQQRNRRRNKLAKVNRRKNIKSGHVNGKQ